MAPIDLARFAPTGTRASWRPLAGLLRGAAATIAQTRRALGNRRRTRSLLDLDDHILADIGIDRPSVEHALNARWYEDPSRQLARVAQKITRR